MQKKQASGDLPVIGTGVLENGHSFYLVPSESDPTRYYVVEQHPTHLSCTCKDHYYRNRRCKHIAAVVAHKMWLQYEQAQRDIAETAEMLRQVNEKARMDEMDTREARASRGTYSTHAAQQPQSMLNRTRAFSMMA